MPTQQPNTDPWERRAERIMRERETITNVAGQPDTVTAEQSFFDVMELQPDRSNDSEIYRISGNKQSIAEQASLLLAFNELLSNRLSGAIDFKRWTEAFEDGFPQFANKSKRLSDASKPWGKSKDSRPKIVERFSPKQSVDYKLVEFWPDRGILDESYLFAGSYREIIQQIVICWNTFQRIADYDIGAILGYPMAQYSRQQPKTGIQLQLKLAAWREPPFTRQQIGRNQFQFKIEPRQVTIPYPKKEILTYQILRDACGGNAGLNWGEWLARAYLAFSPSITNFRGLSQMIAGGPTKEAAERNLDRFLALTQLYPVGRNCMQINFNVGARAKNPRSEFLKNFSVFPAWCFIENSALVEADDIRHGGKPTLSGKLISKDNRLQLWQQIEPSGWARTLQNITRSPYN